MSVVKNIPRTAPKPKFKAGNVIYSSNCVGSVKITDLYLLKSGGERVWLKSTIEINSGVPNGRCPR